MEREKGHVKLPAYLDSHDKFLMSVAAKGVIKLFTAVSKAQNAQKGLNPSRAKDAKGISVAVAVDVSLVDMVDVAIFILHTS
ncbi:hypothetical protein C5167_018940 [Papaver somniferum]|uniref:Uncharacterized protein n=1 Tax=Papaver somniferum TaxID=3469 RepID=A0A4Y7IPB6_PAPSO|nr:hypothetical protein C5167_018940 [Papaver somniferum]